MVIVNMICSHHTYFATISAREMPLQTHQRRTTAGDRRLHALLIFRLARVDRLPARPRRWPRSGMRTHEFAVLHHLHQAGPLSQQELGGALRINPSNLVGLLDELEADGLDRPRRAIRPTAGATWSG